MLLVTFYQYTGKSGPSGKRKSSKLILFGNDCCDSVLFMYVCVCVWGGGAAGINVQLYMSTLAALKHRDSFGKEKCIKIKLVLYLIRHYPKYF